MKKTLIIISIFFSLIVILLATLPFIVDINDIVAVQIPKIEKTINRKVNIGTVRLTLFEGLGAQINDVNISDRLQNNNFVAFESIRIGIKLIPLLNGKIVIDDIGLIKPFISIKRDQNGKFNFSDMMADNSEPKETPTVLQESKKSSLPSILDNVEISKIYIKNGKINFNDNIPNASFKQFCLDDFEINLKNISLQKKIGINVHSNVMFDSQVGKIEILGQIGPINKELDINKIPVDINLALKNLNLSAVVKQFPQIGINFKSGSLNPNISLKGDMEKGVDIGIQLKWENFIAGISLQENQAPSYIRINGPWDIKSNIKDIAKKPNVTCVIQMDDSELSYGTLIFKPQKFPLNMNCQVNILNNSAVINNLKFKLGDLVLTSAAKIRDFSSLFVELSANIPKVEVSNIINLMPDLSKYKIKTSMDMVIDCRGKLDDIIALKGIQAGLNIYETSLFLPDLNKNIKSLRSTFLVDRGLISIEDTGFSIGSSSIDFEADIKDLKSPKISFNMISPWLDIDELLPANSSTKEESSNIQNNQQVEQADTKQSSLPSLSINGIVKVDKGKYKNIGFSNFYTKVSGNNVRALLDKLELNIFSGTIAGKGYIDLSDIKTPAWQLNLSAMNIEANTMINSFSSINDILYGTFTGDFKIDGKGDDVQTALESLTAAGNLSIKNGQLKNISIMNMLGQALIKLPNLGNLSGALLSDQSDKEGGIKTTQFNDLSTSFDITNGKIQTKALKMISDDCIVDAKGTMGLDLGLNFTGNADISESVIPNMSQDRILSQLLDERGHFIFPFSLKGTLLKPSISINQQFFENKLKQAAKVQTQKIIEQTFGKDVNETTRKLNESLKKLFR